VGAPRQRGLAERQPLQLRHARLDHEPPAAGQMGGGVLEARRPAVLRGQVEDRVEDQLDERELALDARCRHVACQRVDPLGLRLGGQAREHGLGFVDPPTMRTPR
jgi:hypothetical protein